MRVLRIVLPCIFIVLSVISVPAQTYILNGSATQNSCNCYSLTQAVDYQSGSVWNSSKINLSQPFDFWFNVYLGCKDGDGADGIVFILQTVPTNVGGAGGGMGFLGVTPSVGVALDTWQNQDMNDPPYDHISIQVNGNIIHGNDLAGPVAASANGNNIEDCQWHVLRISWDPAIKSMQTWFDDSLRVKAAIDLQADIFTNNQDVYWGFSAATGGANNLHQFCTALNPGFKTNFTNNITCIDNGPVAFINTSVSFAPIAGYYWDFGDGTNSTLVNPPPHVYANPGLYRVKLAVTGLDGCKSDTLEKIVAVGDKPLASFDVFDTCAGKMPRIADHSSLQEGTVAKWKWILDGNTVSENQQPQLKDIPAGAHNLELQVASNYGCMSLAVQKQFDIKPIPQIKADAAGACVKVPVKFNAEQLDNATMITKWNWDYDDGISTLVQGNTHTYQQPGKYNVQVTAMADNGCLSVTDTIAVVITKVIASAGDDIMILKNEPYQLHATGGNTYSWSPSTGMNDASIADPVVVLQDDATYKLVVENDMGCADEDFITISVFKGSDINIPTAFSPNNDGLNEELKASFRGIKKLSYFNVYNRWGQLVFSSPDMSKGWDGKINGVPQSPGIYVWQLKAVDYIGKIYEMNGTTVLIR